MGKRRSGARKTNPELSSLLSQARAASSQLLFKEVIGSGAFGTVRRCVQKATQTVLCAKSEQRAALDNDPRRRSAFVNEHRCLSSLKHPNIVDWHGVYTTERDLLLVIEFGTLGDLSSVGTLSPPELVGVTRQVLSGVAYMASLGWVHGDLKLQNCVVTSSGPLRVKLIDFGCASKVSPAACGVLCCGGSCSEIPDASWAPAQGTVGYMAPEALISHKMSLASDIWSAGVLCYALRTSGRPYPGSNREEAQLGCKALCEAPEKLTVAESRMLRWDPHHRPCAARVLEQCDSNFWTLTTDADTTTEADVEQEDLEIEAEFMKYAAEIAKRREEVFIRYREEFRNARWNSAILTAAAG